MARVNVASSRHSAKQTNDVAQLATQTLQRRCRINAARQTRHARRADLVNNLGHRPHFSFIMATMRSVGGHLSVV